MVILLGREMALRHLQSSLLRRTSPDRGARSQNLLLNDPG